MRPNRLAVPHSESRSFDLRQERLPYFSNPWHFHPEIELLYCIKGRGTNFIGNSIRQIEEGEILLLGKNLPHTRQRDREYYTQNKTEIPESIVIQFKEDFLGSTFFQLRDFFWKNIFYKVYVLHTQLPHQKQLQTRQT